MAKRTEKKPEYLAKIFKEYGNIISSGLDVLEEKKNYRGFLVNAYGRPQERQDNHRFADSRQLSEGRKADYLPRRRG